MSDSYYELVDDADPQGERFVATDMVRSTWSAAIQHGAPVSALLVRALERFESREDTRLSRVLIDLLGPVPAEGDLWVRAKRERSGKQIELISAEMLALGPDGEPRPVAQGQRMATADDRHRGRRACARAAAASGRRRVEPRHEEGLGPQLRAQPGLAVADQTAQRRARRVVDQTRGRPRQGRDA